MILYIDTLALLYRSYYAIPNLTTPDGVPTGALEEERLMGYLSEKYNIPVVQIESCLLYTSPSPRD